MSDRVTIDTEDVQRQSPARWEQGTQLDTVPEERDKEDFKLSEEKLKEYREAFKLFDKDESNSISVDELKTVLMSLGKNPTEEEVLDMIAEVDVNENGTIEFDEFIQLMENEEKAFASENLMRQAFAVLDPSGNGFVTPQSLKQVISEMGLDFTDEEIEEMMKEADPSGDGRVKYDGLIGLMSTENETLASAYEKRVKIEKMEKEERVRREAEEAEQETQTEQRDCRETVEAEVNGNVEENIDDFEVPDMEEIASQFDNTQYDKFSRQQPVGMKVVRRPIKKTVPMSRTRMLYLQRKNMAVTPGGISEPATTCGSALSARESLNSGGVTPGRSSDLRHFFKTTPDSLLATINDERRIEGDSKLKSHPPKQYRHVESRLLEPNYYLKQCKRGRIEDKRVEIRYLNSTSFDFEINQNKNKNSKTVKNSPEQESLTPTSDVSVSSRKQPNAIPKTYAERARYDKQTKEFKVYYAIWRSAFTKALEKLREDKKLKSIQLGTSGVMSEVHRTERKQKLQHRTPVISPSLYPTTKSMVQESSSQILRPVLNRGSYTQNFKNYKNVEETHMYSVKRKQKIVGQEETEKAKHGPKLGPLQKRGGVITRSALNRGMNLKT